MAYADYLRSRHWKGIKRTYYREKPKCWVCGSKYKLNIHHLSYKTIGREDGLELVVLCAEHHHKLHFSSGKKEVHKGLKELRKFKNKLFPKRQISEKFKNQPRWVQIARQNYLDMIKK